MSINERLLLLYTLYVASGNNTVIDSSGHFNAAVIQIQDILWISVKQQYQERNFQVESHISWAEEKVTIKIEMLKKKKLSNIENLPHFTTQSLLMKMYNLFIYKTAFQVSPWKS